MTRFLFSLTPLFPLELGEVVASHETIYRWIYSDKDKGGELYKLLLRVRKHYRKRYGSNDCRGKIQDRKGIEERPKIVEGRQRSGGWEDDGTCKKWFRYLITIKIIVYYELLYL